MSLRNTLLIATSFSVFLIPASAFAEPPDEDDGVVKITGGATRVEDYLNSLPRFVAAQGATTLSATDGTAQADLRGLGPERTLLLINGRRLPYGSSAFAAPDLNQVPMALIERVETVTGGASAVFGSDAIAGVVNFILMRDFEGVRIDGQVSAFQHVNDSEDALGILAARGFAAPNRRVFDGESADINLIAGVSSSDGRANITAYAGYQKNAAILQGDRDYSACLYGGGAFSVSRPFGFSCLASSSTPNGLFLTNSGTYTLDEAGPGDTFRPLNAADAFNVAPTRSFLRKAERYVAGGFAHYEVDSHFDIYSELMFYDYASDAQLSHTAVAFATSTINCDNPLMSAQQGALICGPLFGLPIPVSFYPSKRFVEGEPRNTRLDLRGLRIVGGLRGEIANGWRYDASFQYADSSDDRSYENDISLARFARAIDVVDVAGTPTCRSVVDATDPACVPLNLFRIGGVTPAALAYLQIPAIEAGDTKQYIGQAVVSGDLGRLSPLSDDGIGVAAGFEWRKERLSRNPDAVFLSGDLAGLGGAPPALAGSLTHRDIFAEINIPLISDRTFADRLTLEGGYRNTNPSNAGSYSAWKAGADWALTPEFRVRGQWQRAARTPNLIELFSPQTTAPVFFFDPCAGPTPFATFAECQNTGIPPGLYASIPENPIQRANARFGGNPALVRESAESWTVGGVLAFDDFLLTVDYFDIRVDDLVSEIPPYVTMSQCLATGDPAFCGRIHRDGAGTLWINGFIEATNGNLGRLSTSGIDFAAQWSSQVGRVGGLAFEYAATYMIDHLRQPLPSDPDIKTQCAGFYAGDCGGPKPDYRHRLATTWETPIGLDLTAVWRRVSAVHFVGIADPDPSVNRIYRLDGRNYIDLAASYDVARNLNITFGVNNLLDKDPPPTSVTISNLQNGNTFPQTYDAFGRYFYLGVQIDLFSPNR